MARTIWKYTVPVTDEFELEIPGGARFLSFQVQGNTPILWVLVDPEAAVRTYRFRLLGTGHPATGIDAGTFLGTIQTLGGGLVWHLWLVP